MEEERKCWASVIRSCVLSSKELLTPNEINRDMKKLEGKSIPYKQLKYNSLVEMLKDINGLKVFKTEEKTLVKVIASPETSHVQKLVKLQKNSKKTTKRLRASPPPRYNTRQSKMHEPPTNARLDRLQNNQYQNNASLPPQVDQFTTPSPNIMSQSQQYHQQPLLPDPLVLLVQPVIQVVPYVTIDPQLMGLSLQFLQYLSAPYFQYISLPSHSSNHK